MMSAGRLRILVTGIHGDSGQGLVKALRLSRTPMELHGCDSAQGGLGGKFVRRLHRVPPASAGDAYLEELDRIARANRMDAVLPSLPAEIDLLAGRSDPPALPSGVPVICLPRAYRDIFDDKLLAYRFLEPHVPLAPHADGNAAEAVEDLVRREGFPLVAKRRRGRGGDSLHVVQEREELGLALSKLPDPVVQGWIDDAQGEFTVGLFAASGRILSIAFRRRLGRTGSSWFAETSDDPEVLDYARAVARASGLQGSANVQVRKSSRGVRLLEVNARFSSLAPARAIAGFRDVEWSILQALGRNPELPEERFRRIRFHRFIHEMVDDGAGYRTLPEWSPFRRSRLPAGSGKDSPPSP